MCAMASAHPQGFGLCSTSGRNIGSKGLPPIAVVIPSIARNRDLTDRGTPRSGRLRYLTSFGMTSERCHGWSHLNTIHSAPITAARRAEAATSAEFTRGDRSTADVGPLLTLVIPAICSCGGGAVTRLTPTRITVERTN